MRRKKREEKKRLNESESDSEWKKGEKCRKLDHKMNWIHATIGITVGSSFFFFQLNLPFDKTVYFFILLFLLDEWSQKKSAWIWFLRKKKETCLTNYHFKCFS